MCLISCSSHPHNYQTLDQPPLLLLLSLLNFLRAFTVQELLLITQKLTEKTRAVIPSFHTPKLFTSGHSQYQRKSCSLSYTVKISKNAARQMKEAFGILHYFYELKQISNLNYFFEGWVFWKTSLMWYFWSFQQYIKLNKCRKLVYAFGNLFCIIMTMPFPAKREKGNKLYTTCKL